ncbi:MAG: GNAT family N-acetyltransferase [Acidobacteria bacterium]|nr:GNAT family N-acetyltransferase [Acidobacteriota bacterium]
MADRRFLPISRVAPESLLPLLEEEAAAWLADLRWDYAPIRQILVSLARRRLLPGYAALDGAGRAVAYSYFLVTRSKGVIGALYASRSLPPEEPLDRLLALTVDGLKGSPAIRRVEAQIMPFHRRDPTEGFTRRAFRHWARQYLERALTAGDEHHAPAPGKIIPWDAARLEDTGGVTLAAYREQADAEICADYGTRAGCEAYVRSLVGNPGCGIFMPAASFMALDEAGAPCAYIVCSRISARAAMIPQIAVHPARQGNGLGRALMARTLARLYHTGFESVSLTVTERNARAFDWYRRLGFLPRRRFGAYVWER